jgi:hypothetical protein
MSVMVAHSSSRARPYYGDSCILYGDLTDMLAVCPYASRSRPRTVRYGRRPSTVIRYRTTVTNQLITTRAVKYVLSTVVLRA